MRASFDLSELYEFTEELKRKPNFNKYAKRAIRELAKDLVDIIKGFTPKDEGVLVSGWDKRKIRVLQTPEGFEVQLLNDVPYAQWVNDGHMAYNQYGGPYPIKQENRKLQMPHATWQTPSRWYVYGHFFVERGILTYEKYGDIEGTIAKHLEKWWQEI